MISLSNSREDRSCNANALKYGIINPNQLERVEECPHIYSEPTKATLHSTYYYNHLTVTNSIHTYTRIPVSVEIKFGCDLCVTFP